MKRQQAQRNAESDTVTPKRSALRPKQRRRKQPTPAEISFSHEIDPIAPPAAESVVTPEDLSNLEAEITRQNPQGSGTSPESLDLLPHHAALITASVISLDVARSRGYKSVTKKSQLLDLGFGKSQTLVPALLIPVWGVSGEIVLYQARPDTPRIKNAKPVKYETQLKARMALDVPPTVRKELLDPGKPLFVTEGIRKADAAASIGLVCIDLIGVWNWRGTNEWGGKAALPDWESVALNGRVVYIVFDSDAMSKPSVHASLTRLKAFLGSQKADVWIIYLPPGPNGEKVGLDDYLASGHSKEDLLALATPGLRFADGTAGEARVGIGSYLIDAGRLCVERNTREGSVTVPLCNFAARVVEETILDDGVEPTRGFVIDGSLDTGEPLPRIRGRPRAPRCRWNWALSWMNW